MVVRRATIEDWQEDAEAAAAAAVGDAGSEDVVVGVVFCLSRTSDRREFAQRQRWTEERAQVVSLASVIGDSAWYILLLR